MSGLLGHRGLLMVDRATEYDLLVLPSAQYVFAYNKNSFLRSIRVVGNPTGGYSTNLAAGNCFILSPDGRWLVTGDSGGPEHRVTDRDRQWLNVSNNSILALTGSAGNRLDGGGFSADSTRFYAMSDVNLVRAWDTTVWPWVQVGSALDVSHGNVQLCTVNPAGTEMAVFSTTANTRFVDLATMTIKPVTWGVASVSGTYSPNGKWIVKNLYSGTFALWDTVANASMTLPVTMPVVGIASHAMRWLPDSSRMVLVTGANAGAQQLFVYDTSTVPFTHIPMPTFNAFAPSAIAISPDGKYLAIVGTSNIHIYEFPSMTLMYSGTESGSVPNCLWTPFYKKLADPHHSKLISHLRFDGTDNSTTITDSIAGKTWTATGTAKIEVSDNIFHSNGASLRVDGTVNCGVISTANAGDSFGTGDFTVRFKYYGVPSASRTIWDTRNSADSETRGALVTAVAGSLQWRVDGTNILSGTGFVGSLWNDVEVCREAGVLYMFIGGVLKGTVADTRNYTNTIMAVGRDSWREVGGSSAAYIDEFQVYKGVALHTANFDPPISPRP